jgi:Putative mono-oxygenase ydhR.
MATMMLSMRFTTPTPIDELRRMSEQSFPMFHAVDGLLQKYWVGNDETGEVGGIYLWEDEESLRRYLDGPIVAAIPEKFEVVGPVRIEVLRLDYVLNPERVEALSEA